MRDKGWRLADGQCPMGAYDRLDTFQADLMTAQHVRHKPKTELEYPRELVLACPVFKSQVNLSRIVRLAGCCGITKIISEGSAKVDPKIARDAMDVIRIEKRRSLAPVLKKMKQEGFSIIGLEQTDTSHDIHEFQFERKAILVIGHERLGITEDVLAVCDQCIEIPVYGLPHSYNVVTATTMALYEYCKQFPKG